MRMSRFTAAAAFSIALGGAGTAFVPLATLMGPPDRQHDGAGWEARRPTAGSHDPEAASAAVGQRLSRRRPPEFGGLVTGSSGSGALTSNFGF